MVISTIALRRPLLQMKDQHTCHHGPCLDSVLFLPPVAFTIPNSAHLQYTVKLIREISHSIHNHFTSIHPSFSLKAQLPTTNLPTSMILKTNNQRKRKTREDSCTLGQHSRIQLSHIPCQLNYTLSFTLWRISAERYSPSGTLETPLNESDAAHTFSVPWYSSTTYSLFICILSFTISEENATIIYLYALCTCNYVFKEYHCLHLSLYLCVDTLDE